MARYNYKALNPNGKTVSGNLDADSRDQANEILSKQNLVPLSLRERADASQDASGGMTWFSVFNKVHPEDLILFTKQFSTMLRAGIPVLRVMETLENQTEMPRLKQACATISTDIRHGLNLHRALQKHPDIFSPLYCSMVLAGETSGALPQILERLIYVISHEHKVKSDVRSVLQYPILVLIALSAAFTMLIVFVIPRFAVIYSRAEIDLPAPTRICIALSNFFRDDWLVLVTGLLAIGIAFFLALRTPRGRFALDRFSLQIPLIGPLLVKAALSRFAGIFSILQASGVGILESIRILADTIGNAAISRELHSIQEQLEQGQGLAKPISRAKYFTPMFINMVAIGEEAGNLDEMLKEISSHYDTEVEYATRRLTTAIGPMLIVLLAGVVGFFALAVYMPMWDIAKIATKPGG